jgi:hypothetical protein
MNLPKKIFPQERGNVTPVTVIRAATKSPQAIDPLRGKTSDAVSELYRDRDFLEQMNDHHLRPNGRLGNAETAFLNQVVEGDFYTHGDNLEKQMIARDRGFEAKKVETVDLDSLVFPSEMPDELKGAFFDFIVEATNILQSRDNALEQNEIIKNSFVRFKNDSLKSTRFANMSFGEFLNRFLPLFLQVTALCKSETWHPDEPGQENPNTLQAFTPAFYDLVKNELQLDDECILMFDARGTLIDRFFETDAFFVITGGKHAGAILGVDYSLNPNKPMIRKLGRRFYFDASKVDQISQSAKNLLNAQQTGFTRNKGIAFDKFTNEFREALKHEGFEFGNSYQTNGADLNKWLRLDKGARKEVLRRACRKAIFNGPLLDAVKEWLLGENQKSGIIEDLRRRDLLILNNSETEVISSVLEEN